MMGNSAFSLILKKKMKTNSIVFLRIFPIAIDGCQEILRYASEIKNKNKKIYCQFREQLKIKFQKRKKLNIYKRLKLKL